MNVTLVLTHDCNLRCLYCYAGKKFRRAMSWDVAKRAIDLGLSDSPPWMDLAFFGGEPLMELPLLRRALGYAREQALPRGTKVRPQVTTNGTMLTDEVARFLATEGFYVGLSIDGCREAHEATRPLCDGRSSFDAVVAGLDHALAHRLRMEVIAVVDPANVRWLAQSVAFLADRGVPRIAVNPNFQAEWTDEARAELERQYELVAEDYARRHRLGKPSWVNFIDGKIITRLKKGFSCRDKCGFGVREIAVAPRARLPGHGRVREGPATVPPGPRRRRRRRPGGPGPGRMPEGDPSERLDRAAADAASPSAGAADGAPPRCSRPAASAGAPRAPRRENRAAGEALR